MKTALVALLLLSFSVHAQVKEEVDRFTGKVKLTYSSEEKIVPDGRPHIVLSWNSASSSADIFLFTGSTREWRYLKCNHVNWLADGAALATGETTHHGEVSPPRRFIRLKESIIQTLSLENLEAISSASSVEFRICNDEYALTSSEIDGFRQFLAKAKSSN